MKKEKPYFTYTIHQESHDPVHYTITLDNSNGYQYPLSRKEAPDWLELGYNQCPHCPLSSSQYPLCPVAQNIYPIVADWKNGISHQRVSVEVLSPLRTISTETTLQKALSSLLGLLIGSSDCPHAAFFRPMAYFHLPFSTTEETFFRVVSSYLTLQKIRSERNIPADQGFDELKDFYNNIHIVNKYLSKRILSYVQQDASINAVVLLDILTASIPMEFEKNLNDMRALYNEFLSSGCPDSERDKELL